MAYVWDGPRPYYLHLGHRTRKENDSEFPHMRIKNMIRLCPEMREYFEIDTKSIYNESLDYFISIHFVWEENEVIKSMSVQIANRANQFNNIVNWLYQRIAVFWATVLVFSLLPCM